MWDQLGSWLERQVEYKPPPPVRPRFIVPEDYTVEPASPSSAGIEDQITPRTYERRRRRQRNSSPSSRTGRFEDSSENNNKTLAKPHLPPVGQVYVADTSLDGEDLSLGDDSESYVLTTDDHQGCIVSTGSILYETITDFIESPSTLETMNKIAARRSKQALPRDKSSQRADTLKVYTETIINSQDSNGAASVDLIMANRSPDSFECDNETDRLQHTRPIVEITKSTRQKRIINDTRKQMRFDGSTTGSDDNFCGSNEDTEIDAALGITIADIMSVDCEPNLKDALGLDRFSDEEFITDTRRAQVASVANPSSKAAGWQSDQQLCAEQTKSMTRDHEREPNHREPDEYENRQRREAGFDRPENRSARDEQRSSYWGTDSRSPSPNNNFIYNDDISVARNEVLDEQTHSADEKQRTEMHDGQSDQDVSGLDERNTTEKLGSTIINELLYPQRKTSKPCLRVDTRRGMQPTAEDLNNTAEFLMRLAQAPSPKELKETTAYLQRLVRSPSPRQVRDARKYLQDLQKAPSPKEIRETREYLHQLFESPSPKEIKETQSFLQSLLGEPNPTRKVNTHQQDERDQMDSEVHRQTESCLSDRQCYKQRKRYEEIEHQTELRQSQRQAQHLSPVDEYSIYDRQPTQQHLHEKEVFDRNESSAQSHNRRGRTRNKTQSGAPLPSAQAQERRKAPRPDLTPRQKLRHRSIVTSSGSEYSSDSILDSNKHKNILSVWSPTPAVKRRRIRSPSPLTRKRRDPRRKDTKEQDQPIFPWSSHDNDLDVPVHGSISPISGSSVVTPHVSNVSPPCRLKQSRALKHPASNARLCCRRLEPLHESAARNISDHDSDFSAAGRRPILTNQSDKPVAADRGSRQDTCYNYCGLPESDFDSEILPVDSNDKLSELNYKNSEAAKHLNNRSTSPRDQQCLNTIENGAVTPKQWKAMKRRIIKKEAEKDVKDYGENARPRFCNSGRIPTGEYDASQTTHESESNSLTDHSEKHRRSHITSCRSDESESWDGLLEIISHDDSSSEIRESARRTGVNLDSYTQNGRALRSASRTGGKNFDKQRPSNDFFSARQKHFQGKQVLPRSSANEEEPEHQRRRQQLRCKRSSVSRSHHSSLGITRQETNDNDSYHDRTLLERKQHRLDSHDQWVEIISTEGSSSDFRNMSAVEPCVVSSTPGTGDDSIRGNSFRLMNQLQHNIKQRREAPFSCNNSRETMRINRPDSNSQREEISRLRCGGPEDGNRERVRGSSLHLPDLLEPMSFNKGHMTKQKYLNEYAPPPCVDIWTGHDEVLSELDTNAYMKDLTFQRGGYLPHIPVLPPKPEKTCRKSKDCSPTNGIRATNGGNVEPPGTFGRSEDLVNDVLRIGQIGSRCLSNDWNSSSHLDVDLNEQEENKVLKAEKPMAKAAQKTQFLSSMEDPSGEDPRGVSYSVLDVNTATCSKREYEGTIHAPIPVDLVTNESHNANAKADGHLLESSSPLNHVKRSLHQLDVAMTRHFPPVSDNLSINISKRSTQNPVKYGKGTFDAQQRMHDNVKTVHIVQPPEKSDMDQVYGKSGTPYSTDAEMFSESARQENELVSCLNENVGRIVLFRPSIHIYHGNDPPVTSFVGSKDTVQICHIDEPHRCECSVDGSSTAEPQKIHLVAQSHPPPGTIHLEDLTYDVFPEDEMRATGLSSDQPNDLAMVSDSIARLEQKINEVDAVLSRAFRSATDNTSKNQPLVFTFDVHDDIDDDDGLNEELRELAASEELLRCELELVQRESTQRRSTLHHSPKDIRTSAELKSQVTVSPIDLTDPSSDVVSQESSCDPSMPDFTSELSGRSYFSQSPLYAARTERSAVTAKYNDNGSDMTTVQLRLGGEIHRHWQNTILMDETEYTFFDCPVRNCALRGGHGEDTLDASNGIMKPVVADSLRQSTKVHQIEEEIEEIEVVFVEDSFFSSDSFKYGEKKGLIFDWIRDGESIQTHRRHASPKWITHESSKASKWRPMDSNVTSMCSSSAPKSMIWNGTLCATLDDRTRLPVASASHSQMFSAEVISLLHLDDSGYSEGTASIFRNSQLAFESQNRQGGSRKGEDPKEDLVLSGSTVRRSRAICDPPGSISISTAKIPLHITLTSRLAQLHVFTDGDTTTSSTFSRASGRLNRTPRTCSKEDVSLHADTLLQDYEIESPQFASASSETFRNDMLYTMRRIRQRSDSCRPTQQRTSGDEIFEPTKSKIDGYAKNIDVSSKFVRETEPHNSHSPDQSAVSEYSSDDTQSSSFKRRIDRILRKNATEISSQSICESAGKPRIEEIGQKGPESWSKSVDTFLSGDLQDNLFQSVQPNTSSPSRAFEELMLRGRRLLEKAEEGDTQTNCVTTTINLHRPSEHTSIKSKHFLLQSESESSIENGDSRDVYASHRSHQSRSEVYDELSLCSSHIQKKSFISAIPFDEYSYHGDLPLISAKSDQSSWSSSLENPSACFDKDPSAPVELNIQVKPATVCCREVPSAVQKKRPLTHRPRLYRITGAKRFQNPVKGMVAKESTPQLVVETQNIHTPTVIKKGWTQLVAKAELLTPRMFDRHNSKDITPESRTKAARVFNFDDVNDECLFLNSEQKTIQEDGAGTVLDVSIGPSGAGSDSKRNAPLANSDDILDINAVESHNSLPFTDHTLNQFLSSSGGSNTSYGFPDSLSRESTECNTRSETGRSTKFAHLNTRGLRSPLNTEKSARADAQSPRKPGRLTRSLPKFVLKSTSTSAQPGSLLWAVAEHIERNVEM
jgi:hypothetical protein